MLALDYKKCVKTFCFLVSQFIRSMIFSLAFKATHNGILFHYSAIIALSDPQSIYTDLFLLSSGCSFAFALSAFHPGFDFCFFIHLSKSCSSHAFLKTFVDCCNYGNLFTVLTLIVLVVTITYNHPFIILCVTLLHLDH